MSIYIAILVIIAIVSFAVSTFLVFEKHVNYFGYKKGISNIIIVALFLVALCAVILIYSLQHTNSILLNPETIKEDYSKVGVYGDLIGGILNPVVAFIGIVAASLAFYAQYRANSLIQEQFDEQKRIDYRQNFETTFFNMLSNHHQIVDSIDFELYELVLFNKDTFNYIENEKSGYNAFVHKDNQSKVYTSRDVFNITLLFLYNLLYDDLYLSGKFPNTIEDDNYVSSKNNYNKIVSYKLSKLDFNNKTIESKFKSIYDEVYSRLNTDLGHYFRNLYRIVKIIDERKFVNNKVANYNIKYSYTSILRAQLSDDEISWLFFNCLSDMGSEKFKPLIEKYGLLKILDKNDSDLISFYRPLYKETAFRKPSLHEIEDLEKRMNENLLNETR